MSVSRTSNKGGSYWMTHQRPVVADLAKATGLSEWRTACGLAYWATDAEHVSDREAIAMFANEHSLEVKQ